MSHTLIDIEMCMYWPGEFLHIFFNFVMHVERPTRSGFKQSTHWRNRMFVCVITDASVAHSMRVLAYIMMRAYKQTNTRAHQIMHDINNDTSKH